ncbi:MAG: hypothetical protein OEO19_16360, partial [Gammaproteobacteria bacterium]|nr:hypothetical protein [Gammaproteobacteria bacterium]
MAQFEVNPLELCARPIDHQPIFASVKREGLAARGLQRRKGNFTCRACRACRACRFFLTLTPNVCKH